MPEPLATVPELLAELRAGRPVILVDDEDRENEGDLVMAAQTVTPEQRAFTIRHTGGVVCLALTNEAADRLELPPMVVHNTAKRETAFTVSIEAREGIDTGISAKDRATTIRVATADGAKASDLSRPGHVFPLRARDGGVLRRAGHTEAAVDLCRLAGLKPAAVLSELMHDDGSMMRLPDVQRFAAEHGLKVGTIADLIAYRLERDAFIHRVASARLPTPLAEFTIHGYVDEAQGGEHVALSLGELRTGEPVLVRLHSECLTGDALHSLRCDCGFQRDAALKAIAEAGRGVLIYLRQEGRGIGLINKIRAYSLQDQGLDTVEANHALGFRDDERDYAVAAHMLMSLKIESVQLMTNNPKKIEQLMRYGIQVNGRIPHIMEPNEHNRFYLETKAAKSGHMIDFHGKQHLDEQSDRPILEGMSEAQVEGLND